MALTEFTDVANVRRESGFTNNANVTDAMIEPHVKAANAEVNMGVAARYTVPLTDNGGYTGSMSADFLAQVAANLGAGLLLLVQYPDMAGDFESPAVQKITYARKQIKMIQKGEIVLVGTDGGEFDLRDSSLMSPKGFPTSTSTPSAMFTVSDKF